MTAAALCSCTKQQLQEPGSEKQIIHAHVNIGTKTALTDNNPGITSVWEEGDTFKAIQDGSTIVTFTLEEGAGTAEGIFSTTATGVTESTQWVAVFGSAASEHTNELHCAFMGQTGTLEDVTKHAYVKSIGVGAEPSFNFATGEKLAYILRVKLPAGVKCIEYVPCAYKKVTGSGVTNIYDKNDDKLYSALQTSTITLDAVSVKGDCVYIAVPALKHQANADSYAGGEQSGNLKSGVIITILNNTSALANQSNGTVVNEDLSDGKVATVDMSEMSWMNRCLPSNVITVSRGSGTISWGGNNLKQSVSGLTTYWCPFNMGATSEEQIGNYYSFGEYEPRSPYTFSNYSLRRGTPNNSGTHRHYCIASHWAYGSATNFFSIAGGRYDVCRVKWGSAWRMPEAIECWALINYTASPGSTTYVELGTVNSVSGTKFLQVTGGNGYLFFPQSGHYGGSDGTTLSNSDRASWRCANQAKRSYQSDDSAYQKAYICESRYNSNYIMDCNSYDRANYAVPVRAVLSSSVLNWQ